MDDYALDTCMFLHFADVALQFIIDMLIAPSLVMVVVSRQFLSSACSITSRDMIWCGGTTGIV